MIAAAVLVGAQFAPAVAAEVVNPCSDRNALDSIAVDARLVAIKFYYDGFIHGLNDRERQACYQALALNDDKQAIVNKTLDLIERNCFSIETAARMAAEGACP
jgi:hypothetical protein